MCGVALIGLQDTNLLWSPPSQRCWLCWICHWCSPSVCKTLRLDSLAEQRRQKLSVYKQMCWLRCAALIMFCSSSTFCCTWLSTWPFAHGQEPFCLRYCWTGVNTRRLGIRRPEYHCRHSSYASVALPLQNRTQNAYLRIFRTKATCLHLLHTAHLFLSQN